MVRLSRKIVAHGTKLLTLPIDSPVRKALVYAKGVQRHLSPLDTTIAAVTRRLKNTTTRPLLGNPSWIHAPWVRLSHRVGIVGRDQAIDDANRIAQAGIPSLCPDASVTTRLAPVAVARQNKEGTLVVLQESIGWASTCGVLTTKIAAIAAALDYAQESFEQEPPKHPFEAPRLKVTILSDSQHVLKAIRAGNSARTRRAPLRRIAESFYALEERGIDVEFRWVPGHAGVCRNTEAYRAAQEAASRDGALTTLLVRKIREAIGVIRLVENDRKSDLTRFDSESLPGQYTWKLEQALLGQYAPRL
jgi:ribonuclease HI